MVRAFVTALGELAYLRELAGQGIRRATHASAGWAAADTLPHAPEPLKSAYAQAGVEPPLEEVLRDPIVRLVMRADRLESGGVPEISTAGRR